MLKIGSLLGAAIAGALIGMTALAPQAQAIEYSLYTLFQGDDGIDPNPAGVQQLADAIRRAQAPGSCALGKLQIRAPEGDRIFQDAIATTRGDNVLHALDGMGIPVAGRLFVVTTVFGTVGGTDTTYQTALDEKPPRLTTTSVPEKGTKVKPHDQIKITMVARDDPDPWPTGLKTIQLVVDSDIGRFGRFLASENYEPCAEPRERRVEATYEVPDNPPPIVRLTALAEDHVGLIDTDVGEFPTGDWSGTITKTAKGGGHNHTIVVDFAFDIEASGMLKGSAHAQITTASDEYLVPDCTKYLFTYSPSEFDIPLSGRRNGDNFEIALFQGLAPTIIFTNTVECFGNVKSVTSTALNPAAYGVTRYQLAVRDGATNTVETSLAGGLSVTLLRDTITIHQARQ
jgi:hypothetical protein